MSEVNIDVSGIDAADIAQNLASVSDEQLAEMMASEFRGQVLDEIFRRMGDHFQADKAEGVDAVVHFKITGRADGGTDVYETVIRDKAVTVNKEPTETARITISADGVPFLRLVTGAASGPELFMTGKLKIEGDLIFAAQVTAFFTIPGAPA
jgi:putative sterol carrier protein